MYERLWIKCLESCCYCVNNKETTDQWGSSAGCNQRWCGDCQKYSTRWVRTVRLMQLTSSLQQHTSQLWCFRAWVSGLQIKKYSILRQLQHTDQISLLERKKLSYYNLNRDISKKVQILQNSKQCAKRKYPCEWSYFPRNFQFYNRNHWNSKLFGTSLKILCYQVLYKKFWCSKEIVLIF